MATQPALVRGLGLTAAMSINIANIIGTGVFLKARVMTCNVDTPSVVLLVWLLAGILVTAGALTFAELATRRPEAGGEYVILREAYGPRWAFLHGWSYLLVGRGGALAAQSVACAVFFNIATGGLLEGRIVYGAAVALALTTVVNCLNVTAVGRFASTLMYIKTAIVAAVGLTVFLLAKGDWAHYAMSGAAGACEGVPAAARGGAGGFGAAMLGALWGYMGWANLTPMIGEVKDPARTLPRAFLGAVLVVGVLYLLANASYYYALAPAAVASVPLSSSVATEAIRTFLGPAAASLAAVAMFISSAGALQAGGAAMPRVPYAMAADGLFFRVFARISAESRVPVNATILVGAWSAVLAMSGNYDKLTDLSVFGSWVFFGLTAGAVFVFRRRDPSPAPFRVPGYPLVPALFLGATAALLVNTLWTAPVQAFAGIGLILAGIPFFEYWNRRRKTPDSAPVR